MPSGKKTLPKDRKRVTASARARISVSKARKVVNKDSNGSYLANTETVSISPPVTQPSSTASSDAIMSMLCEIRASNADLARRLDKVEQRNSTPINPRSHSRDHPTSPQAGPANLSQPLPLPNQLTDPLALPRVGQINPHLRSHLPPTHDPAHAHTTRGLQHPTSNAQASAQTQAQQTHTVDRREAVVPNLHMLRTNQGISEAVNNLLTSYEERAYSDLSQGKPHIKKSGRYNLHDTVTALPQLRWPNEGFHASNGKKRVTYDDLSLPQWVSGQLSNIYAISDPTLAKQALLQVIHAMTDAVSLPWPTVRAAWASSMHQVEEGHLSWTDSTQWAINRLSASQVALADTQTTTQSAPPRRPCRYFNEGSCSHEGHHGNYSHVCSYCMKQGRSSNHPEARCNTKQRQAGRQQQNSS